MRKLHCSLAMLLFLLSAVTAQERKGYITGHVTDSSQAVVPGARVELDPGGLTAVSDGQGLFTIPGVAPGHYKVIVTAIGFAPFTTTDLGVSGGGTVNVDAVLKVESHTEVIEVRASRENGEIEALNRERTADNILEVLPADVITSLPNTNIADAVGRMNNVSLERDEGEGKYVQIRGTEPRLSNVTVDGVHLPSPENVRNVKLDAIPSDLVDSVELSKTLSANQEGDAIGGSVNLVTKMAKDKPYLSALGMGGYTPVAGGRSLDQFDLTMGQRFFSDKRLGIIVDGGYDWNGRGIDDVEPVPAINPLFPGGPPGPTTAPSGFFTGFNTYDQREYWYDRTRYGFGGTLDYRFSNTSSAYLRGLFSQFKDDGQDWIYSPTVGTFQTPTLTNADGSSSFTNVTRKPSQRLFSTIAGGRNELGSNLLNYEVAFGQARFTGFFPTYSYDPLPNSTLAGGAQFAVDTSKSLVPVLTATNANLFDPTQYVLASIRTGDQHIFERDVTGAIDLSHTYKAGSHFSILEVGFKVRDAHKSELSTQTTFSTNNEDPTAGPVALMSAFVMPFTNPNYYFGHYGTYGPTTDYKKTLAFYQANPNFFSPAPGTVNADFGRTVPADFSTDERVTMGYVMNTINLGNWRVQAGVRFEGTSDSFLANSLTKGAPLSSAVAIPGSQSYVDVLPSVQVQLRLPHDSLLRLAYGMGISRPNFGDLPPHQTFNPDPTILPPHPAVTAGNPNLNPTHAQDFDVAFEKYLKPFGVIEAGFFYKYLTDPIYATTTPLTTGQFAGTFEFIPINGPHAHITGVELGWQQRLSFLPGLLNGSGVRANYSYTSSQATFPPGAFANPDTLAPRTDQPLLQRTAPNNWNFDYTYDKKAVSYRLGVTHNDANIFFYNFIQGSDGGLKGPNGDTYLYPHTQVDMQASYWIPRSHGFQVIGYVLNLTNEVFGFYQGSQSLPIQREYYNRTFAFGLRWTNGRENH